ncbi:ATP-binding response regulator [Haloplanus natans]|uniref:ATP-binding response regulator n=1 Tax=Haloplanus natans TaxID=376171 RepID=UPI000A00CAA9|nr:ATP-binding protein [Haloplanus natans]
MRAVDDPITVLCVNDDPDLLELLRTGLEQEDERLTVRTAASAQTGLVAFEDDDVDCIVSDHHMPDMTGVEFLRAVREVEPELPFVLFTETGTEVAASEAISANVTDYIIRQTIGNQHALVAQKVISHVEHRRMEARAARADERLHKLAELSNDVLWMFSQDWSELLFVNSAYEDLFGESIDALRADPSTFLDRVHEDDHDRVRLAMKRASEGTSQRIEFRVEHPSSVRLWVESHCKPVIGTDGSVERVTGFTRDITQRKTREQDLANRNEQLDQFTSTIAHDLRNPLNVADGHLAVARRECTSSHLKTSAEALDQMEAMLSDLLALARTGNAVGEYTTVAVADVVRAGRNSVRTEQLTLEIDDSARIRCDSSRLKEAVENVLRNAVEHNDRPVTVSAGVVPDRNVLYIEDDGVGIPESRRERVFDSGYTTLNRGTGFGLSIVAEIVEAHDWTVSVDAAATGGARFEIEGVEFVDG